ncbi:MAG TPA: GNAT family N-acetyltransferase [Bryobacteraceae bacterium]|nr:GNAT family N-acetyltransferase [Bryobacteraceae bacterium]
MKPLEPVIRVATWADVPALQDLIGASVTRLQSEDYSEAQRTGALGSIFGVDPALIEDGTYFVAEWEERIVACGGWSRRGTPFGSDRSPARDDRVLDPLHDAARIRALFVHPDFARRGLGTAILEACERAAAEARFQCLELTATLTGIKLFRLHGFVPAEEITLRLGNGETLPVIRMTKKLR